MRLFANLKMACCEICCATLTKKIRAPVSCLYCNFQACQQCVRKFLIETHAQDPECMSCRRPWNTEYIEGQLPRSFIKGEYAEKRKAVLLSREKAKLPGTVDLAARYRESQELYAQAQACSKRIKAISMEIMMLMADYGSQTYRSRPEVKALVKERKEVSQNWTLIRDRAAEVILPQGEMLQDAAHRPRVPRDFFACPVPDCRGFVTDSHACGLCKASVCSDCRRVRNDQEAHTCNTDDVESVKALQKDTKPCPNCAAPISKIDGCDQMWCLSCKTAFSWRTGAIETGRVHNPEYFRWLRESGQGVPRVDGDQECHGPDAFPSAFVIQRGMNARGLSESVWQYGIMNALRDLVHVRYVVQRDVLNKINNPGVLPGPYYFPLTAAQTPDHQDPYLDLRVRYLAGQFSEEDWQNKLLYRERERERLKAARDVNDVLLTVGSTIMQQVLQAQTLTDIQRTADELDAIRVYYNDSVLRMKKRFGTTMGGMVAMLQPWTQPPA